MGIIYCITNPRDYYNDFTATSMERSVVGVTVPKSPNFRSAKYCNDLSICEIHISHIFIHSIVSILSHIYCSHPGMWEIRSILRKMGIPSGKLT